MSIPPFLCQFYNSTIYINDFYFRSSTTKPLKGTAFPPPTRNNTRHISLQPATQARGGSEVLALGTRCAAPRAWWCHPASGYRKWNRTPRWVPSRAASVSPGGGRGQGPRGPCRHCATGVARVERRRTSSISLGVLKTGVSHSNEAGHRALWTSGNRTSGCSECYTSQ